MRGLLVKDGVVENVALFDEIPEGWLAAPDGVSIGWTDNGDGTFSEPPRPEPEPLTAKEVRDQSLQALNHDFGDGRVMQTRPQDESNIRNAIEVMEASSIPSLDWRMQDNTVAAVTADELKTALAAGQLAALQVWANYNAEA